MTIRASKRENYYGRLYLDLEKDVLADFYRVQGGLDYVIRTPNHHTGNLIRNLAKLCALPLSQDEAGRFVIRGTVPCYIDGEGREVYVFRLANTKMANLYPDGRMERKAAIPAIAKTLMSQTKDYQLDPFRTLVKTYILRDCKFRTDLHTHMNANLRPDLLIALGICHQIRYPLYYVKKLGLRLSTRQEKLLAERRDRQAWACRDLPLTGKYMDRRIDDNTFINFADLILKNLKDASYNLPRIRASLAVMKDGQAVFTNLEKVYLYRYVFTKGVPDRHPIILKDLELIPDRDVSELSQRILKDREDPRYRDNTLFQDKLLWIAREYASQGIKYAEISDTSLVKRESAPEVLRQIHGVMPAVTAETGVMLRFLAAIRRIPLTIVKDHITTGNYFRENLHVLEAVAADPYVAGSDILGEEINSIRELAPVIRRLVAIAEREPSFVIRIHAGENDSLRNNVEEAIHCVRSALAPGQAMPCLRLGHGLFTPNLSSARGKRLLEEMKETGTVLEFQITSNVRLNNLNQLDDHPLKRYLAAGVGCVQGTDGGALYGTNAMDEQLALERILGLTPADFHQIKETEDGILARSDKAFQEKSSRLRKALKGSTMRFPEAAEAYYAERIARPVKSWELDVEAAGDPGEESEHVFADRIAELPVGKTPIVLAGGSFNGDGHKTALREEETRLLDALLRRLDPEMVFFAVGHSVTGYERYLLEKAQGRFDIYAFVPTRIPRAEKRRLLKTDARIRISIEPVGMGTYKSLSYEIFKRRPSVLLALDGNAACANLIQDARNAKYPCLILVDERSRGLRDKARSLQGYVTGFTEGETVLHSLREHGVMA